MQYSMSETLDKSQEALAPALIAVNTNSTIRLNENKHESLKESQATKLSKPGGKYSVQKVDICTHFT